MGFEQYRTTASSSITRSMSDSYLKFTNTGFGRKLTSMLGLPQPMVLDRHPTTMHARGTALLGEAQNAELGQCINNVLSRIGVTSLTHSSIADKARDKIWQADQKVGALIFDATGLNGAAESIQLHSFFSETVRSVTANGRVIIVGRTPAMCDTPTKAVVQRSLEGLSRSLAKELRKAITVQLIYLDNGAENHLESTFRFLLSAKSCYVSGQVVRVSKANHCIDKTFDWSQPFAGKKVLVTGASQGIGAAVSEVMARDGAELICLDIQQTSPALSALAHRLKARAISLDLSHERAAEQLLTEAKRDDGWDVVIHNAGITRDKTIAKMKPELWSSVVNINLSIQERINQSLVSSGALREGGRIVCVSSISGIAGNRGQSNYALSKAGVIGMVDAYAPLFADKGITINAVAPGFIETRMTQAMPFAVREAGRRLNSMSQGGLPVDVAEAIAWLASPASSGLTQNVVRVCGQSILGA